MPDLNALITGFLLVLWPIIGWVWGGLVWAKDYDLEPEDFIPFLLLGVAGGPLLPIAWEACRWTERKVNMPSRRDTGHPGSQSEAR